MAIYHLSMKPISRSSGRSAVASIAYRAGIAITDERLGKTYDYTKRDGVLWNGLFIPDGLMIDRNELWNTAEKIEKRSNSRTAREIIINIPYELMQNDKSIGTMLACEFAIHLCDKYRVGVDVAIHAPDKQGDNRNFHAHLLLTTRKIEQKQGEVILTNKSQLEMSNSQLKQMGLLSNQDELKEIRKRWADLANKYLARHNINERIDHRSHKDRDLETLPTLKMGWEATELERKGIKTDVGNQNRAIKEYNAKIEHKNQLKIDIAKGNPLNSIQEISINNDNSVYTNEIPDNVIEWLINQNKSHFTLNETRTLLDKAEKQINLLAQELFNQKIQDFIKNSNILLKEIEAIKNNEPIFFGKKDWQNKLENAIKKHDKIRENFNQFKNKGITDEHKQEILDILEKKHPREFDILCNLTEKLEKYEKLQLDKLAKYYGADIHAQAKERYYGEIIDIDQENNIVLQQTQQGIVLHQGLLLENFTIGKSCTIYYGESLKQATMQPDIEVRTKDQNLNKNKGFGFGD